MTRKDFVLIANAIRLARTANDTRGHKAGTADVAIILSHSLGQQNPRFDSARFLTACGVRS